MISFQVVKSTSSNDWWIKLVRIFLHDCFGEDFSIHCWKEEEFLRDFVSRYGEIDKSSWEYGFIVNGKITESFSEFLIESSLKIEKDCEQGNHKLTPFFNVFLGDIFFSSHYGQEIQIACEGQNVQEVQNVVLSLLSGGFITVYQE